MVGSGGQINPVSAVKFCSMGTIVLASCGSKVFAWDVRNNESKESDFFFFGNAGEWMRFGRDFSN